MSKRHKRHRSGRPVTPTSARKLWFGAFLVVCLAVGLLAWMNRRASQPKVINTTTGASSNAVASASTNLSSMEVAQALMVTVDLDFAGTIKDALKEIERRYQPEDGQGRTFAMLDAYGETNANGKLHISMHLSMEKPGIGSLIFKRTGEELWKYRIVPAKTGPPPPRNLTIIMDDNAGSSVMLDGTKGATRVLDVPIHNSASSVRDLWPDGQEREFTFIYSACGCPVKVKVRRLGETTARTTELPVMFPDDPAAMDVINSLMGWTATP